MNDAKTAKSSAIRIGLYAGVAIAAWSTVIAISLSFDIDQAEMRMLEAAQNQARAQIQQDVIYRNWNASHGGVYVPVTEETPPNPFLSHLPERDLTTLSGRRLTLVNPAYMTRQVHELGKAAYGVIGHITSLNPIRAANAPDPWEERALSAFEGGETEVSSLEQLQGETYLRLMRPLVVEPECLKCHAGQGYSLGDIRGGISASVPTVQLWAIAREQQTTMAIAHACCWLAGLCGIAPISWSLRKRVRERDRAEEERQRHVHDLGERVKELTCMYGVAKAIRERESLEDVFRDVAMLIPPGWHYPDITRGRIRFDGEEFVSDAFEKSEWCQRSDIVVSGKLRGSVEVYHLEQRPELDEGPFMKEKCSLIDGVAHALTEAIEHKQVEEQVEQANAQLLQSAKMVSIGELAAGIAHEINNPIGFISSNLHSLGEYVNDLKRVLAAYDGLLSECGQGHSDLERRAVEVSKIRDDCDLDFIVSDLDNLLSESVEGTKRVRKIVADLRDFSHVDSPDAGEADINELLDKTINVAWNELKYKTEVVREYGEIPAIPCFGGKLGQVFLNLLVNAAQAIEERGTITVRTGEDDSHVWVEVEDTGCGMPPDVMDRIFDPFFTTKEVGKGTGMGLNLAYNIIESHGGRISVKSHVGEGTTFRIELPITGPPEVQESRCESVA